MTNVRKIKEGEDYYYTQAQGFGGPDQSGSYWNKCFVLQKESESKKFSYLKCSNLLEIGV